MPLSVLPLVIITGTKKVPGDNQHSPETRVRATHPLPRDNSSTGKDSETCLKRLKNNLMP